MQSNTPDAHFDEWLATRNDMFVEGTRLAITRYTLAPLSPKQMAAIAVAMAGVCGYYGEKGCGIPVEEVRTLLYKLIEDPA